MLGFKCFRAAHKYVAGIELMQMIRKIQMVLKGCEEVLYANQFYALAGENPSCIRTVKRPAA